MPSWIPGEDHLINFQKGDPYTKVDEGYARLPGAGYAALHPELEGVDPEHYPDITKLSILGDVAPYSREYNRIRASVEKHSRGDAELRSRYEQIVDQVRQTKESTLSVDERHFDAPVDKLAGHLHLVPPSGAHKNPPARARETSRFLQHSIAPQTQVELLSVPGHALRCGPETSVTSPLRWRWFELRWQEKTYPVVKAVGMWESRRDFQRVWEVWEAGFMACHAFHSSSFPPCGLGIRMSDLRRNTARKCH